MPDGTPRTSRSLAMLLAFLQNSSNGGLALVVAALAALVWSNSAASGAYAGMLAFPVGISVGAGGLTLPLSAWVNDGLMALFFLTVALEIRRELTDGHLASLPQAVAPGLAALGGMVAPALIYAAFNHADAATRHGWAVPVATDIAFVLAALSTLGSRIPLGLKVFLTALAIIDDLGAIVVIALFYTSTLDVPALAIAAAILVALYGINRAGMRAVTPYVAGGAVLWLFVLKSGIHPTLAGVAVAFVVPNQGDHSVAERLEDGLGAWVTWVVLPLFGLTNAGLALGGLSFAQLGQPAVLGTLLGLVVGKQLGVFGTTMAAVRLGLVRLPDGLSVIQVYGGAVLCGIGFTMSLFIGDLSFHGTPVHDQVKLAVFLASLLSAGLGLAVLALAPQRGTGRAQ